MFEVLVFQGCKIITSHSSEYW